MSAPEDRPNPLGHIRFPHAFDPSRFIRTVEETAKFQSKIVDQLATYHIPQIDWAGIDRATKRYEELFQSGLDHAIRFSAMLEASRKSMEQAQERIASIVTSGSFLAAFDQSRRLAESVSESVLRLPSILEGLSVLEDRVIFKDIVIPDIIMPPAGECRDYGAVLPLEEIIHEDLLLDPVECEAPAAREETATSHIADISLESASRETPMEAKTAAPLFVQHIIIPNDAEIYEHPPEGADFIDEAIALYEPFKSGIFILTQAGFWVKEKDGITPQCIRLVLYLRRIGKRPGQPWADMAELVRHLTPGKSSIKTGRHSIHNRLKVLQRIPERYNCKSLILGTGGLYRINPELSRWDSVGFMPAYHNGNGH